MSSHDILTDVHDGVAVVTLNRPDSRNAWDMGMQKDFGVILQGLADNSEILGIVIAGAGEAFCAGQDLHETSTFGPENVDNWLDNFKELYATILGIDKPVV